MKFFLRCAIILGAIGSFCISGIDVYGATIASTDSGGSWTSASTWEGGVVPDSMDSVEIRGYVTLPGNQSIHDIHIHS